MPTLALDKDDRMIMIQLVGQLHDLDILSMVTPEYRLQVTSLRDRIKPFLELDSFDVALTGQRPL